MSRTCEIFKSCAYLARVRDAEAEHHVRALLKRICGFAEPPGPAPIHEASSNVHNPRPQVLLPFMCEKNFKSLVSGQVRYFHPSAPPAFFLRPRIPRAQDGPAIESLDALLAAGREQPADPWFRQRIPGHSRLSTLDYVPRKQGRLRVSRPFPGRRAAWTVDMALGPDRVTSVASRVRGLRLEILCVERNACKGFKEVSGSSVRMPIPSENQSSMVTQAANRTMYAPRATVP